MALFGFNSRRYEKLTSVCLFYLSMQLNAPQIALRCQFQ